MVDDFTRQLSAVLLRLALTPHLEVEGKLGSLINPSTGHKQRVDGVLDHLVLLDPDDSHHTFKAELPQRVFAHLNDRVIKSRYENEQQLAREQRRPPRMSYAHPVTTDLFYDSSPDPVRVTVDAAGQSVAVTKSKLHHLDFLLPPLLSPVNAPPSVDFRISVSSEAPMPVPPASAQPRRVRRKDRRSYALDAWRVDCTVVETWNAAKRDAQGRWGGEGRSAVTYEVELEMAEHAVARLRDEAERVAREGAGSVSAEVVEMARSLLENMRSLAKVAVSPAPPSCQPRKPGSAGADDRGKKRPRNEGEEAKNGAQSP